MSQQRNDVSLIERPTNLRPPLIADGWKRGDSGIGWGRSVRVPEYNSEIQIFLVEVSTSNALSNADSDSVFSKLLAWKKQFSICSRLLKQQHIAMSRAPYEYHDIEFFNLENKKISHIDTGKFNTPTIYVNLNKNRPDFASSSDLKKILKISTDKAPIKFEFLLTDLAYDAYIDGDFRKVVLEASSAIEISLTNRLNLIAETKKLKFPEKLLNKFRTLSNLFELASILSVTLPDRKIIERIVNIRNRMVHTGKVPLENEAKFFIEEARSIVFRLSKSIK